MSPKISIVTPTLNQGDFIEETILSVIGQGYDNLEYIIIDGGSTDNTVEIIKKYEKFITHWISEPDMGQSDAINKGFEMSSGEILGWLNSDDLYMPGCLKHIAETVDLNSTGIYFGNCIQFKNDTGGLYTSGSDVSNSQVTQCLKISDYILQPSSFWTRSTWTLVGSLNWHLNFVFDWDWFLRAESLNVNFYSLNKCLSLYRIHSDHKSGTGGEKRQSEIKGIYEKYSPDHLKLYQLLIIENLSKSSFIIRLITLALKAIKQPHHFVNSLKLIKYGKYKKYSTQELTECYAML